MTINIDKQSTSVDGPQHGQLAPLEGIDDAPGVLLARARECPADYVIDWHQHRRAQLLYAVQGVMQVMTDAGIWIVPPQRAVWIPPGIHHRVQARGAPLSLRSLYIREDMLDRLPKVCCVVTVSPLLRELIVAAMEIEKDPEPDSPDSRLAAVLLDQIEGLPVAPLHLPMVMDPRLKRISDCLLDDPADDRSLAAWANDIGASERTLARLFLKETGLTFGHWRQQVRLLDALERLAHGASVTAVAYDLGYASQSAFIAMFRKALGKTPGRYFAGT